eukprot:6757744-Prorocentrum_lima.AAC.1
MLDGILACSVRPSCPGRSGAVGLGTCCPQDVVSIGKFRDLRGTGAPRVLRSDTLPSALELRGS